MGEKAEVDKQVSTYLVYGSVSFHFFSRLANLFFRVSAMLINSMWGKMGNFSFLLSQPDLL